MNLNEVLERKPALYADAPGSDDAHRYRVHQVAEVEILVPFHLEPAKVATGGERVATRAGIEWTYVAYKGGSQAVADVVAGHADVLFNGMLPTYPFVKAGKLRALAVSSAKRVAAAPDLPTVAEAGFPGFETGSWQGVLAPAGTRREIVDKLNGEIRRILDTPEMKARLAAQGTEVRADSPEALARFVRTEIARWAKVVKQSGVKIE